MGITRSAVPAIIAACIAMNPLPSAAQGSAVPLAERIRGAHTIVVATPSSVSASWQENASGDRLIVSRFVLRVEETLKGTAAATLTLDLEGGTLDGFTLHVSSLPQLSPGERAVFMLDEDGGGVHRPHLRGQGILKLDDQNVVKGSSLRLDDIRRAVLPARN